ncbi:hypothetical protein [Donghicola mangrovi]|uniref:Uncharacterized protein n=1 Tax=Donghicola mangrovi TaxID=2729614 RepID=A0A850PYE8_9RHOB|nr:hypothetical protein [Donghicola mangrovi]NVO21856.1 hypothetical protein [Donghicola mangrovi]
MSKRAQSPSAPPGLYDRSEAEPRFDISPGEWIAVALTIVWLALCALFFFGVDGAPEVDGLRIVIEVLAVFMPIGMVWVGATASRSARIIRDEAARLHIAIDGIRQTYMASQQHSPRSSGSDEAVLKKLDALLATQTQTESALAIFSSSRRMDAIRTLPETRPQTTSDDDQPSLALGTSDVDLAPPLSNTDFIRALHFPETPEDKDGFAALRRGLADHQVSQLIQASQDILTLLSQDGIYMDDLRPDRARPELWRKFAAGERGGAVSALGGIRDRSSLALTAGRMRQDPIFRDAAHHFLRRFDKVFASFTERASDEEINLFADTRTARAFMLVGRAAGTFD